MCQNAAFPRQSPSLRWRLARPGRLEPWDKENGEKPRGEPSRAEPSQAEPSPVATQSRRLADVFPQHPKPREMGRGELHPRGSPRSAPALAAPWWQEVWWHSPVGQHHAVPELDTVVPRQERRAVLTSRSGHAG